MKPKTNKFNKKSEENSPDKKLPGNFDEVPIGKSSFSVSEFPEGGSGQKEMNYPMTQKLKSKALKLRLSGLEDLQNLLEDKPDHPDLEEVEMSKLLKETNPGCL